MAKLDDVLAKNYPQIRKKLVPPKRGCPKDDLIWHYVNGELGEEDREEIEGHFLACSECLESLKVIRMIQQAQESPQQIPDRLYKNAQKILQNELEKANLQENQKTALFSLGFIWDHVQSKIIKIKSDIEEMIITPPLPKFQPARKVSKNLKQQIQDFPLKRAIKIDEGIISIEIDASGKAEYLSLKISLKISQKATNFKNSSVKAKLYKQGKVCSLVNLDNKGEAIFSRIKDGIYSIELHTGEKSLGLIELSIDKV